MSIPYITSLQNEKENSLTEFIPKPNLQLITGGKEPPSTGDDWLSRLPVGTVFYAKPSDPNAFILAQFCKVGSTTRAVILQELNNENPMPVCPRTFSSRFRFFEELGYIKDPKQEEEEEDGTDNRIEEQP